MLQSQRLASSTVLVTGATGFLGSQLAIRLARDEEAHVAGTGRDLSKVEEIFKSLTIKMQRLELLDHQALWQAVHGRETIFHLAGWTGALNEAPQAHALNVEATEKLVELSAMAGVKRIVFVSSIAAYGYPEDGVISESHPVDTEQDDPYGRTKALAEKRGFAAAKKNGVEFAVVRPGMIYGPHSTTWTLTPLRKVKNGNPVLFGDGLGHACPVYIENVIDALILAATHPHAPGEAFNICDETITMGDFFGYYGRMCGSSPRLHPSWAGRMLRPLNKWLDLGLPVSEERMRFFSLKSRYTTEKMRDKLGYSPSISINEGMQRTEAWLRESGHLAEPVG